MFSRHHYFGCNNVAYVFEWCSYCIFMYNKDNTLTFLNFGWVYVDVELDKKLALCCSCWYNWCLFLGLYITFFCIQHVTAMNWDVSTLYFRWYYGSCRLRIWTTSFLADLLWLLITIYVFVTTEQFDVFKLFILPEFWVYSGINVDNCKIWGWDVLPTCISI